jgi:type IV pilus assembly protein PilF
MNASPLRRRTAAVALAWLLAACSSPAPKEPPPPPQPEPQTPIKVEQVTPQRRSELHRELGAGYYERGQMDVAIDELNEAVKLDPNNAKAYNTYALVYAVLGEPQKAEQNFQRALQLSPDDPEIRQNWGFYLCTHGQQKASLAEFEIAARNTLYKTPEIPLVNAGRCSASLNEFALAESYFRRALAASPNNEAATLGLAQLAYRAGRLDEARRYLRTLRPTTIQPDALYLAMCVERKLGDRPAETSYAAQLRNRFPEAPETKALATGVCE